VLASLAVLFFGTLTEKTGFLRNFLLLFIGNACLSLLITSFKSSAIESNVYVATLAYGLLILTGVLMTRKSPSKAIFPLAIYSSIALGVFASDILLLPSYIQWCNYNTSGNSMIIGGGSFVDGIFLYSLCGLLAAFLTMKVWRRTVGNDPIYVFLKKDGCGDSREMSLTTRQIAVDAR